MLYDHQDQDYCIRNNIIKSSSWRNKVCKKSHANPRKSEIFNDHMKINTGKYLASLFMTVSFIFKCLTLLLLYDLQQEKAEWFILKNSYRNHIKTEVKVGKECSIKKKSLSNWNFFFIPVHIFSLCTVTQILYLLYCYARQNCVAIRCIFALALLARV